MAERLRAGGAGIPAFYTATAVGTPLETGEVVIKYDSNKKPVIMSTPRPVKSLKASYFLIHHFSLDDDV